MSKKQWLRCPQEVFAEIVTDNHDYEKFMSSSIDASIINCKSQSNFSFILTFHL